MIVPVAKRVLIQPYNDDSKAGPLIYVKKPVQYTVLAIGNEVTHVKSGDIIYLEKHYGVEIDHEGQKYLVIDEASILAKISQP